MSKQKTFWAHLKGRKVLHLWTRFLPKALDVEHIRSACGLTPPITINADEEDARKCKNCTRALKD